MCLALIMLWLTCLLFNSAVLGSKGKYSTLGHTAQLKQIQHPASCEVCSQVYNMEIKVHFYFDLFTQSTINRDHVVLGFLAQKYHPKTHLKFLHYNLAVLVRHSQAQKCLQSDLKPFPTSFYGILKIFYLTEFYSD